MPKYTVRVMTQLYGGVTVAADTPEGAIDEAFSRTNLGVPELRAGQSCWGRDAFLEEDVTLTPLAVEDAHGKTVWEAGQE